MPTTLRRSLRPALNLAAASAVAATLTLAGPSTTATATPSPGSDVSLAAATTAKASTSSRSSSRRHLSRGEKVARAAAKQVGDRYRYGASGPSAFDCSGLTSYVYKEAAHKKIPRTSSAQANAVKRIAKKWAKKGDLVFFTGSGGVYHVGVYAGNGYLWHAPNSGERVKKEKIWTSSVFYGRVRW